MEVRRPILPGILGVVASAMGIFFAGFSTHDYALHLDRQLHNTHCSFIPGLTDATAGSNACTAAMYSPYSALFRDKYWGGVPISLFAIGAYAFFLAFAVYLLTARNAGSKRAWQAYGVGTVFPFLASIVMFSITLKHLDGFCKLCVGLYTSSAVLLASGIIALLKSGGKQVLSATDTVPDTQPLGAQAGADGFPANTKAGQTPPGYPEPAYAVPAPKAMDLSSLIPTGSVAVFPLAISLLGVFSAAPALAYVGALPDYRPMLVGCGKIPQTTEKHNALVKIPTVSAKQPAILVVDPLCPTCKAFHERLVTEDIFEKLDVTVAVFPLDSDCNWMLDRPLHPGACVLAKAVLCGGNKARDVLEWSYANQTELTSAGKAGKELVRAQVRSKFPELDACIDAKETKQRLDHILHWAVDNKLSVSTPQMYLGDLRVCDEDTDLGLRFTMGQLAPDTIK
ncbi:MAG: vitamin K epoxide reductase family protein [Polyangiaceae bacterium]